MQSWRLWISISGVLLMRPYLLPAQDLDANITSRNRQPAAIADQIHDPSERSAFLELYRRQDPKALLQNATRFVTRFPRSAFLAQAYEIGAKSSFDLGEYESGLEYGKDSIALLPENPLLLVAMADVEAREKRNDAAIHDGTRALEYLEEFARPVSVSVEDWPSVEKQQKSSALFAVGRAQLQKSLEERDGNFRKELVNASLSSLSEAAAISPDDDEIQYLHAIALLSAGQISAAASQLAGISARHGGMSSKAMATLQDIYAADGNHQDATFDRFVERLRRLPAGIARKAGLPSAPGSKALPEYAGSEECKGCHADIYRDWSQTGMATMLRAYRFENVTGDFKNNNQFYTGEDVEYVHGQLTERKEGDPQLFAVMFISSGRHYFKIRQSDGSWRTYPVDYTIGSKWQQAYATRLPNGEIHVFPIQYSMLKKRWINYWRSLDGEGTERSDPHNFERLDNSTSYQEKCAICHTSQLRNAKGGGLKSNDLEFRETGVGCEMCHGPAGDHVVDMESGSSSPKPPDEPPVDFKRIGYREFVALCAQCHAQSSLRDHGPQGELNYSTQGKFYRDEPGVPLGEFTRKGFYKDGRFSQTTFIVEALRRTRCYREGNVSCGTCHDPHGHGFNQNQTSLRYKDDPDKMCTGCHSKFREEEAIQAHTHHAVSSEGSRCVSCHMPRIMDALTFSARTHQIDDIPNPQSTLRFGAIESPNACLLCHKEKTASWVAETLQKWRGIEQASSADKFKHP